MNPRMLAPLVSLALLVGNSANPVLAADPFTRIDQLSASITATDIAVTGSASFRDVPVQVGSDAAADATVPNQGADLTQASISSPTASKLRFTVNVAGPLPEVSSGPFVVYLWPITVDGVADNLWLHASRFQAGAAPSTPRLRVVRIADGSITTIQDVEGTMADGLVAWDVPLALISAKTGSVVTAEAPLASVPGISGVGTLDQSYDTMEVSGEYEVPSRRVRVGIAPITTPAEEVLLATTATIASDGSFSASLARPADPGAYRVAGLACYGPQSCGLNDTEITV